MSKVEKVISACSQSIYYHEISLEFRDSNDHVEKCITLEPCPGKLPTCQETILEDKFGVPWLSPRKMEPLVPLELLKSWVKTCEHFHGKTCDSPPWTEGISWPQSLRLIDVKRNCIVNVHEKTNYIALSYVWGIMPDGLTNTTASRSNIQLLQVVGYLLETHLPRTIRDAMGLARDLGETYLWVDCLCIVQDDSKDLAIQIPQVRLTFRSTSLILAFAVGVITIFLSRPSFPAIATFRQ